MFININLFFLENRETFCNSSRCSAYKSYIARINILYSWVLAARAHLGAALTLSFKAPKHTKRGAAPPPPEMK